jgi:hypothetical protein
MILVAQTMFSPCALTNAKSLPVFVHNATIEIVNSFRKYRKLCDFICWCMAFLTLHSLLPLSIMNDYVILIEDVHKSAGYK